MPPHVHIHLTMTLVIHVTLEVVTFPCVTPEECLASLARERSVVHPVGFVPAYGAYRVLAGASTAGTTATFPTVGTVCLSLCSGFNTENKPKGGM